MVVTGGGPETKQTEYPLGYSLHSLLYRPRPSPRTYTTKQLQSIRETDYNHLIPNMFSGLIVMIFSNFIFLM